MTWCWVQILSRAPQLEAFRMASSRVGMDGGIALANSMMAGKPHTAGYLLLSELDTTSFIVKQLFA